jgi:hypothetical protein
VVSAAFNFSFRRSDDESGLLTPHSQVIQFLLPVANYSNANRTPDYLGVNAAILSNSHPVFSVFEHFS